MKYLPTTTTRRIAAAALSILGAASVAGLIAVTATAGRPSARSSCASTRRASTARPTPPSAWKPARTPGRST